MLTFSSPTRDKGDGRPRKTYLVRVRCSRTGRRRWVSTGQKTLKNARAWVRSQQASDAVRDSELGEYLDELLRHQRRKQAESQATEAQKDISFEEAWRRWIGEKRLQNLTEKHIRELSRLGERFWLPTLGPLRMTKLDGEGGSRALGLYLDRRRAGKLPGSLGPVTATTANADRKYLKVFFSWCGARALLTSDPIASVPKLEGETRTTTYWLTREEEARLLDACRTSFDSQAQGNADGRRSGSAWVQRCEPPSWLYPMVMLALQTGLRRSTLLQLQWQHVDIEEGVWNIPAQMMKRRHNYRAPLTETARRLLVEYRHQIKRQLAGDEDVTQRLARTARLFGLSTKTNISRVFKGACKRGGLPDLKFHDLRRIFYNRCREKGIPMETAMALTDHRSIVTVKEHYGRASEAELRSAVQRLDAPHALTDGELVPDRRSGSS